MKYTRELVMKLLTSSESRSNERDIESFRTKISSSTALAATTTRGSDLHKMSKTRANKTGSGVARICCEEGQLAGN